MNESKISVRYAKALFLLAKERNIHEQVKFDMQLIINVISNVPEFDMLIHNPVISLSKKNEILTSIFQNHVTKSTLDLFNLIIRNKREMYLGSIARVYIDLFKKEKNIKSAKLITSQPVDDELRNAILKSITKKLDVKIEMGEETDEKIIGGFILRIEDQQINASVANHLNKIKKELLTK